jgi:hypothetical protein
LKKSNNNIESFTLSDLDDDLIQNLIDKDVSKEEESYKLKSTVIECKEDENHYIYDQSHNPIYWPATVTISSDEAKEGAPSVVVQS